MEGLVFVLSVIAGVLILVCLVVIHELGHAIAARRNGVVVEEFGVGFPPAAKTWTVPKSFLGSHVVYSLNWLPLGGFVKLKGENDAAKGAGTFGAASFAAKTKIMFAGVLMNWAMAIVLFTILALIGMPKVLANQFYVASDATIITAPVVIDGVTDGLPAQKAGLQKGDTIKSVTTTGVTCVTNAVMDCPREQANDIDTIIALTKSQPDMPLLVTFVRDGKQNTTTLHNRTAEAAKDGKGYIGVVFSQHAPTTIRSTWSAPINGVGLTAQLSWETLKGIGGLFVKLGSGLAGLLGDHAEQVQATKQLGDAGNSVAGPVGILFTLLPNFVRSGLVPILLISAVLSLTLAVMNILPIPALDGGRWYLMAGFRLFKKPLTKEREEKIVSISMMVLIGLVLLITIGDVRKLF